MDNLINQDFIEQLIFLSEDEPEFFETQMNKFFSAAQKTQEILPLLFEKKDWSEIRAVAHKQRSSAGQVGASAYEQALAAIDEQINTALRDAEFQADEIFEKEIHNKISIAQNLYIQTIPILKSIIETTTFE